MTADANDVIERARVLRERTREVFGAMVAERAALIEKMRAMSERMAALDAEIRAARPTPAKVKPPPRRGSAGAAICAVLRAHPEGLVKAAIFAEVLKPSSRRRSKATLDSMLAKLVHRGIVVSEGDRGKSHRYRLADDNPLNGDGAGRDPNWNVRKLR